MPDSSGREPLLAALAKLLDAERDAGVQEAWAAIPWPDLDAVAQALPPAPAPDGIVGRPSPLPAGAWHAQALAALADPDAAGLPPLAWHAKLPSMPAGSAT